MRRGAPRGGLRDLPGVSRGQQLGDVAGAALRDGLLFLLEDEVLVDRRFDGREHADRNREVGGEKIGEELGGVHVRLVMNPEGTLGHVLGADHLRGDPVHDEGAPIVRRPEEQGLTVLEHGKPLLFGPPDDRRALIMHGVTPKVVRAKDVPESTLWIHDETNVNAAKLLADLFAPDFPIPVGVLTAVEAPVYEDLILQQEQKAISERGPGDIAKLLTSGDTWKIS